MEDVLNNNTDIKSESEVVEKETYRMFVKDTDIGKRLLEDIYDLKRLLEHYRKL